MCVYALYANMHLSIEGIHTYNMLTHTHTHTFAGLSTLHRTRETHMRIPKSPQFVEAPTTKGVEFATVGIVLEACV
jgi:hypothetical protein